ncbi:MAG: SDR family NAD(P)-dependent oxidoreductase [Limisphaerales bacterium]
MSSTRFDGQRAVITGGASGIGRAIVKRLATEGAKVLLVDVNRAAATEVRDEVQAAGGTVDLAIGDVSDAREMGVLLAAGLPPSVLVNCAGIAHIGTVVTTRPEDLDRLYAVNVKGVYHGLHFVVPRMIERGGGAIVNLASVAARLGIAERFAYSMTKGAVLAMTLSVARDFVAQGIRCNAVCPARIHTPFVDGYLERNYPERKTEMKEKLSAYQPIGRMGTPEEVAALVAFLCSDEAAFVTGSAYDIDGGVTLLR